MKTATRGLDEGPVVDLRKSVLTFHSPFPLFTSLILSPLHCFVFHFTSRDVVRSVHVLRHVHCPGDCVHLPVASVHFVRSVHVRVFDQRSVGISDRSVVSQCRNFSKKQLDAASCSESFLSLSLERQRSAGKIAHPCAYTGASVFDRYQKFCKSAAHLDGLVNLRWRGDGDGKTEPDMERCGSSRVRADTFVHQSRETLVKNKQYNLLRTSSGFYCRCFYWLLPPAGRQWYVRGILRGFFFFVVVFSILQANPRV